MTRTQVRLFVGIHVLAVMLIYLMAIWVGGHQVGDPMPANIVMTTPAHSPDRGARPADATQADGHKAMPEPVLTADTVAAYRPADLAAPWARP